MVRQILRVDSKNINISVPDEYIGKEIEVLTFAINEGRDDSKNDKLESLNAIYNNIRVDFTDFVFKRDEANNR